jgi:hypothetical protein
MSFARRLSMVQLSELTPAERQQFYRRALLAPVCLCLVAALHLARVWTVHQTPWKGGGFGMFSTVDAESARFLRCWLITNEGKLPLPLPPAVEKPVAEMRAAPSQAGLMQLATRLAAQSWRWRDDRQQSQRQAITNIEGVAVSAAALRSEPNETDVAALTIQRNLTAVGLEHVLEPVPLDQSASGAVLFSAVRVECWRYWFDPAAGQLRAEKIMEIKALREATP